MRLIIIDDQLNVLKNIKSMLTDLQGRVEIELVYCNVQDKSDLLSKNEDNIYLAKSEDELFDICKNKLKITEGDRYLIDITLLQESQIDKEFSEYLSVKLAMVIDKTEVPNVKIKFYTRPFGISIIDFAEETKKWGVPLYRPALGGKQGEMEAKETFVTKIKEYCNV